MRIGSCSVVLILTFETLASTKLYPQSPPCGEENAHIRRGKQSAAPDPDSKGKRPAPDFLEAIASLREGINELLKEASVPECGAQLAEAYAYLGYSYLNLPYAAGLTPKKPLSPTLLKTLNEEAAMQAFQQGFTLNPEKLDAVADTLASEFARDNARIGDLYRRIRRAAKASLEGARASGKQEGYDAAHEAGVDEGKSEGKSEARRAHDGRGLVLAAGPVLFGGALERQDGAARTKTGHLFGIPFVFGGVHHEKVFSGRLAGGILQSTGLADGLGGVGVVLSPALRLDVKGVGLTFFGLGKRFRTSRSPTEPTQGVWGFGLDVRLHPWPRAPKE